MHYYRIKPELWPLHLKRAQEAGLNTISTYIPWSWHESEQGKFDFTGATHPQRNIVGFIKQVKAHGLKLSVRVGPTSNAEMINEGVRRAYLLPENPGSRFPRLLQGVCRKHFPG